MPEVDRLTAEQQEAVKQELEAGLITLGVEERKRSIVVLSSGLCRIQERVTIESRPRVRVADLLGR